MSVNKSKIILIIDDSNTTLVLLDWALKKSGYKVLVSENVKDALRFIKKKKPDLIILDLSMPSISGYDFLKMRPEINITEIPVIVVSAFDNPESVKQSMDLGASEFISKPFKIDDLLNTVEKYLKQQVK